jgi:enoyl-CoA hydratase/carnithine racemase
MTAPSEAPEHAASAVLSERRGGVLILTLNRPARLNAWNTAIENGYFEALAAADLDPGVRAIVVTGAGRGFCAGADMDDLAQAGDVTLEELGRSWAVEYPLSIRKPLIAAINGAAAGVGLVQALFCDRRFCTPEAKLTTSFARRGLIAEYGSSWLLPRIVGRSAALDLLLSGRVIRGTEALALGLVDQLHEPDALLDAAVAYATDLADNCSPSSMAVIKEQVGRHLDVDFATAVRESDALMHAALVGPDVKEGAASFMERRPPRFVPLAAPDA